MIRAINLAMACMTLLIAAGQVQAAPIVHTVDFIPDGSRSHFNGFESIPNDGTL